MSIPEMLKLCGFGASPLSRKGSFLRDSRRDPISISKLAKTPLETHSQFPPLKRTLDG